MIAFVLSRVGLSMLAFLLLLLATEEAIGAGFPKEQFFSYGALHGDDNLGKVDDKIQDLTNFITEDFIFFDKAFSNVSISVNGLFSFGAPPVKDYNVRAFPLDTGVPIVAPFWSDVDTRVGDGEVWYRVTNNANDATAVNKVKDIIATAFEEYPNFIATQLIIATWDEVGRFHQNIDMLNTFQCVIATDGSNTFAIFLFADIQWTAGEDVADEETGVGVPQSHAQVGFDAGDGIHFRVVNGSLTEDIGNIEEQTNVGITGQFVFQVNGIIRSPGEESCPIIGTAACENRVFKLACQYLDMTKNSIPRPCQEILS